MSDEATAPVEQKAPDTKPEASAPAADVVKTDDAQPSTTATDDKPAATKETTAAAAEAEKPAAKADVEMKDAPEAVEKASAPAEKADEPEAKPEAPAPEPEKPAEEKSAAEEKPASEEKPAETAEGESAPAAPAAVDATPVNKNRRKSAAASTGKKLNKKQSKAKIQHLDAKPGDHFFAKLKGFPPWPVIICDEVMLPQNMLAARPVSAMRPDGTYRDGYEDGGKKVGDRSYAVMYLQTNEFSWTRNTDLEDLDPSTVADLAHAKMRKDLAQAHVLAAEQNDIDHYKQVLRDFEEARVADQEAKAARARAKKEKHTKKSEPKDEDEDVDMADVPEGDESDTKKSKKRKAEDDAGVPQRSDSVKKPKIKLTSSSTPKAAANGVSSPKEPGSKASKAKSKGSKPAKDKEADGEKAKKEAAPKEPELTPEEKLARKEASCLPKEILFLRHRLQKGLLNKDANIKESDMQSMSDYLGKLEAFPDLEGNIIRATKINKVLKAMLKIAEIPKESEFNFKPRSQALLEQWNKTLAVEPTPAAATAAPTNGVNGTPASKDAKETNGVNGEAETSQEPAKEEKTEAKDEVKEAPKAEAEAKTAAVSEEKPAEKAASAEAPVVESSA
ncbi:uncharacterized protein JN550_009334 [Neoarthrinium moseri]|uniref:uncharacterized protein n=1 Tax=Neoarthrinium moseri TaxID=1658444 RepID=UPI001FDCEC06|nr:uncharacterized protein JN550_009334 [Neoarthrinium moseri]KAI1863836.1 hypothetical protein JN550_009334 [Neoarthrinium moseri]